jgi:aminopeptidase N
MSDMAEMWLHEGFCTYAEAVYVEHVFGREAAKKYIQMQRVGIANEMPIISRYELNDEPPGDMYKKGAQLLNNLRTLTQNDSIWWNLIYDFSTINSPRIAYTKEFVAMYNQYTGKKMDKVFEQYLNYAALPKLMYELRETNNQTMLLCYWQADVDGFDMPVLINVNGKQQWINPSTTPTMFTFEETSIDEVTLNKTDLYYANKKIKEN